MVDFYDKLLNSDKCFIIAEIGSNHNGSFDNAIKLMDVAHEAGADAVKFQSFLADHMVSKESPDYDKLKTLEVPELWYSKLKAAADERGLEFFSTATNSITLGWLQNINTELYKIASPNLTHIPLIKEAAKIGKSLILSTGMATMYEVEEAIHAALSVGNQKICILHCLSMYPTPPSAVNLKSMVSLKNFFPYPVGYSDHTLGNEIVIAAVALGAKIIEKHITLDRSMPGPDHYYSSEPKEFIDMVRAVRNVEKSIGSSYKQPNKHETQLSKKYWRSIHASKDMSKGYIIKIDDLKIIRPNDGLHSRYVDHIVGMKLTVGVDEGDKITWDNFKIE